MLDGCYRMAQGERGDGDRGKKEQASSTRVDKGQSRQERGWQREVLAVQQSTTAEVQRLTTQMQKQWDEQQRLFERIMRNPPAPERQPSPTQGMTSPPAKASTQVERSERQPTGRPGRGIGGQLRRAESQPWSLT